MKIHTTLTLPPELGMTMDYRNRVLGIPHARGIIAALETTYGTLNQRQKIELAQARRKAGRKGAK